jgi:hypothetical protein
MTYAAATTVPVVRTKAEIEELLEQHGACGFMFGQQGDRAVIIFVMEKRRVHFELPLPAADEFREADNGRHRSSSTQAAKREQALRSRWRALFLAIKAKLVSVECGVETFEEAFLAQIVVPGGSNETMGSLYIPHLAEAYEQNKGMPVLLPPHRG